MTVKERDRKVKPGGSAVLVNPKPVTNAVGHRGIFDLLIGWIRDKYISWRESSGRSRRLIDKGSKNIKIIYNLFIFFEINIS